VLGSGEGAIKKRLILRINEEVKVEMIRDDGRRRSRHEQKEVSCWGVTVNVSLYILLVIPQHDRDSIWVPMYCLQLDR
jgi:hypothetical protein